MLGDFNMVEKRRDKSRDSHRTLSASERLSFNGLKDTLQVSEYLLTNPSLSYSWDNARTDNSRIMARLDRIYLFPDSPTRQRKILEYRIKGDNTRSDHSPVTLTLELSTPCKQPNRWIMSSRHLEEAAPEIHHIWLGAPSNLPFNAKLRRVTVFYRKLHVHPKIKLLSSTGTDS